MAKEPKQILFCVESWQWVQVLSSSLFFVLVSFFILKSVLFLAISAHHTTSECIYRRQREEESYPIPQTDFHLITAIW